MEAAERLRPVIRCDWLLRGKAGDCDVRRDYGPIDVAYCLALFLAFETCNTIVFGGIPEGSATERTLGWTAVLAIIIAPVVLWCARKTRAARYLQDGFIIVAIAGVVAAITFS